MSSATAMPLVPARMLNEFAYCPRLAYLEWVEQDFADSADTIDGRTQHRRVDRPGGDLAEPAALGDERVHARSIDVSAPQLGLIAKIDIVEAEDGDVVPVDYKRGKAPDLPEGAWEPERVQLCAQGLILRENGYRCDHGEIYFVGSRRRVRVDFDDALCARTLELLAAMRETAKASCAPPPLVASPKCPRCSLVGICLPDEINLLQAENRPEPRIHDTPAPRRLLPAHDEALPLYVQSAGARIGREGEELVVEERTGERHRVRLIDTSQVALFGGVQITTFAVRDLCDRGIPVVYFSSGGWFSGLTTGMWHKNVELRRRQYRTSFDETEALRYACRFVATKIRNCRTLLRRNGVEVPESDLDGLRALAADAEKAKAVDTLLGIEGTAGRIYFQRFGRMLKGDEAVTFDLDGRNRRPPKDPVNSLLSLLYAVLAKDVAVTLLAVGFDPFLGFLHQPRYGRPALALDLMEEFRPLIADSVVLAVINNRVVTDDDFVRRAGAVSLKAAARSRVLAAYERRLEELITHPIFGYRISYRRTIEVQARLLARALAGEISGYPGFMTR